MSFSMPPLPTSLIEDDLIQLLEGFKADAETKSKLFECLLQLHNYCATARQARKALLEITENVRWQWPEGRKYIERDSEADNSPEALLELLFFWVEMRTHQLYRRGQILDLLSKDLDRRIEVHTRNFSDTAPCGRKNSDVLLPTEEILRQMPPCDRLICQCGWILIKSR